MVLNAFVEIVEKFEPFKILADSSDYIETNVQRNMFVYNSFVCVTVIVTIVSLHYLCLDRIALS